MTETVFPKEVLDKLHPRYIVPLVGYLCHESSQENGQLFEIGGGYIAKIRWQRAEGSFFESGFTAEDVKAKMSEIGNFDRTCDYPTSSADVFKRITEYNDSKEALKVNKISAEVLQSDEVFSMLSQFLALGEGKPLIPKVASVFGFQI
jgi:hypothetical protein